MNTDILNNYGIELRNRRNELIGDFIDIKFGDEYPNLGIFLSLWVKGTIESQILRVSILNDILNGGFNDISYDDKEITLYEGVESYSGLINENLTFDILYDDGPEDDDYFEQYPLEDIRDIFLAIVEFKQE